MFCKDLSTVKDTSKFGVLQHQKQNASNNIRITKSIQQCIKTTVFEAIKKPYNLVLRKLIFLCKYGLGNIELYDLIEFKETGSIKVNKSYRLF